MPSPEKIRTERIEQIFSFFENSKVKTLDPIVWKTKMLYPTLKESTKREYAAIVLQMLEAKPKEIEGANV